MGSRIECATTFDHVPMDATQDAGIGIRVDEEPDVKQFGDLRFRKEQDFFDDGERHQLETGGVVLADMLCASARVGSVADRFDCG